MLYLLQSEILDDNRIEFLMILYDSIYCLSLHRQHQRQNNEYIVVVYRVENWRFRSGSGPRHVGSGPVPVF